MILISFVYCVAPHLDLIFLDSKKKRKHGRSSSVSSSSSRSSSSSSSSGDSSNSSHSSDEGSRSRSRNKHKRSKKKRHLSSKLQKKKRFIEETFQKSEILSGFNEEIIKKIAETINAKNIALPEEPKKKKKKSSKEKKKDEPPKDKHKEKEAKKKDEKSQDKIVASLDIKKTEKKIVLPKAQPRDKLVQKAKEDIAKLKEDCLQKNKKKMNDPGPTKELLPLDIQKAAQKDTTLDIKYVLYKF